MERRREKAAKDREKEGVIEMDNKIDLGPVSTSQAKRSLQLRFFIMYNEQQFVYGEVTNFAKRWSLCHSDFMPLRRCAVMPLCLCAIKTVPVSLSFYQSADVLRRVMRGKKRISFHGFGDSQ